MAEALVLSLLFLLGYSIAGYPVLLELLVRLRAGKGRPSPHSGEASRVRHGRWASPPPVQLLMSVYNEAETLPAKLDSLAALRYPGSLQLLVIDDGSTDDSGAIVAATAMPFAVRVIRLESNSGKAVALNTGMQEVDAPVTVLTDARQALDADAVTALVEVLQDPDFGAVSAELIRRDGVAGLYWRLERWLRRREGELWSCVGASGALYAIDSAHYTPLLPDTILDDLEIPMQIARQGYRVGFCTAARVYEAEIADSQELHSKVRTLIGNFQSMSRHPWLLNPWANPLWWQFVSHKTLRLLMPWMCMGITVVSLWQVARTGALAWVLFLVMQIVSYGTALAAQRWPGLRRARPVGALIGALHGFGMLNLAALIAAWRFARGDYSGRWKEQSKREDLIDKI